MIRDDGESAAQAAPGKVDEVAATESTNSAGELPHYHRIGGASINNMRLKQREASLVVPGISVIRAGTPQAAAAEVRAGLPGAKRLSELARVVGSASKSDIRRAGFDIVPNPSTALPNHCRLIHHDGVGGFCDDNLRRLIACFSETTGN